MILVYSAQNSATVHSLRCEIKNICCKTGSLCVKTISLSWYRLGGIPSIGTAKKDASHSVFAHHCHVLYCKGTHTKCGFHATAQSSLSNILTFIFWRRCASTYRGPRALMFRCHILRVAVAEVAFSVWCLVQISLVSKYILFFLIKKN